MVDQKHGPHNAAYSDWSIFKRSMQRHLLTISTICKFALYLTVARSRFIVTVSSILIQEYWDGAGALGTYHGPHFAN